MPLLKYLSVVVFLEVVVSPMNGNGLLGRQIQHSIITRNVSHILHPIIIHTFQDEGSFCFHLLLSFAEAGLLAVTLHRMFLTSRTGISEILQGITYLLSFSSASVSPASPTIIGEVCICWFAVVVSLCSESSSIGDPVE